MTASHLLTFQMKQSRTLWSLPPMSSACLLSAEHFSQRISLSEKWEHVETKENSQRRPSNNSLVIKHSQGPLVPPQGLQIIFWAISCELSYRYWNPHQVKEVNYMMTRLQPWYCCCSVAQLCPTLCSLMHCSMPGLPVPHCLPKFAQVHVYCIGDAIQPSHPLMPSSPLPSIFSSIRDFSNELVVHIRWPRYWSFSFSISPSNVYSQLISLSQIEWFDLLLSRICLKVMETNWPWNWGLTAPKNNKTRLVRSPHDQFQDNCQSWLCCLWM